MVRILGIDPGSRCTGYGVIQDDGKGPSLVAYGAIRASADTFPARLKQIYDGVHGVALEYLPGEMAIEQVFMAKNADSALKLGQARGAAICASMNAGLPVFEYAAREVKQALVGRGSAEKSQVQYMIRLLLGVGNSAVLPADASDALGIAMCHLHHRQTRLRMAKAVGEVR